MPRCRWRAGCRISDSRPASRAAIIMTNQSKWLISAYAIFYAGGVLVPLDYKLTPVEQLAAAGALARRSSRRRISSVARHRAVRRFFEAARENNSGHRSAAERRSLWSATLGGMHVPPAKPRFEMRQRERSGLHRLFLRHRRAAERLRPDARKLSRAVRVAHCALSILAGRALPEHSADEPRDRFHGRIYRPVHVRRDRSASAHAASGIHSRSIHALQDHLHDAGSAWC